MKRSGLLIREMRSRAEITQQELAQRASVAQSAISDYERGVKEPSLATLERLGLAAGFELTVDFVADHAGHPPSLSSLRRKRRSIIDLCRRHGASRPRVFGSVAHGTARADSDIDLLVTLDAGRTYFDVAALHDDLADLLGRPVDVLTDGAIHGRLEHIADEAIEL